MEIKLNIIQRYNTAFEMVKDWMYEVADRYYEDGSINAKELSQVASDKFNLAPGQTSTPKWVLNTAVEVADTTQCFG